MTKLIAMNYLYGHGNYDDFARGIEAGKSRIEKKYSVECLTFKRGSFASYPGFIVRLTEKREGGLDRIALKEFFAMAGTPNFVHNGSDYDLVDDVLVEYGLALTKPNSLGARVTVP